MRFYGASLEELRIELERAFDAFDAPKEPRPVYACTTANMPPAADYQNCVLLNTTLNILAHSDGSDWIRQDTGATI